MLSDGGTTYDADTGFRYAAGLYRTTGSFLALRKGLGKALDDLDKFPFQALKVAVINYEATWREDIFERLLAYDADIIIADESQRIKTPGTAQSRAMHQLGDKARYKMILSGTPVQNEAVDIFSQYRFLDPTVFGLNFYAFRNRYCVMGGFNQKQIVRYRDLDILIRKEHSVAYRVTKEEALDLPEQTFENRYITLSKKERTLYDRLRRDSFAELDSGGTITATTVLTRLLRLQQFTGGFLVEDDAAKPQMVSRGKLDALADILQDYVLEGKKKLVIFARFIPEVMEIIKLASNMTGKHGMKTVAIYGEIKKELRGDIVQQFQTDPATIETMLAERGLTKAAYGRCGYHLDDHEGPSNRRRGHVAYYRAGCGAE